MNLNDFYQKQKGKQSNNLVKQVFQVIIGWGILVGFLYVVNFLWNFIGPKFGLPVLTFVEFLALVLTVRALKTVLFANLNQPRQDTMSFEEIMELANKHED